jgi:hypothetical protein
MPRIRNHCFYYRHPNAAPSATQWNPAQNHRILPNIRATPAAYSPPMSDIPHTKKTMPQAFRFAFCRAAGHSPKNTN